MFGVIEADQHPVEGAAKLAIASSCRSMDALRSPFLRPRRSVLQPRNPLRYPPRDSSR